jgi:hypothetical protein
LFQPRIQKIALCPNYRGSSCEYIEVRCIHDEGNFKL